MLALLTFTDKTGTDIVPNQGFHGRGSQICMLGSVLNDIPEKYGPNWPIYLQFKEPKYPQLKIEFI